MTSQRNLKRLVRARMAASGQRYASARRDVLRELDGAPAAAGFVHLPGIHHETAALRVLLANAGVTSPHSGEALSEELVFGIVGGVGTGVMAFRYEAEDFSNFWVSGWNPFQSSVVAGCERLGIAPTVTETSGARTAERQLDELLAQGVPAMAWVDVGELGYLGLPEWMSGGAYHTVVVYQADGDGALVGDRAPHPIRVDAERLTRARGRIRKDRHRLLSLGADELEVDVEAAVRAGLAACAAGPTAGPKGAMSVEGIRAWAARVHAAAGKDAWARVFPRGRHLWGALRNVVEDVEHADSGGGLMRPMYARFLREAATLTDDTRLDELAGRYDELGAAWSELAAVALPGDVPALAATRDLLARGDELFRRDGAAATDAIHTARQELEAISARMDEDFPLSASETDALLADLARRLEALYAGEVAVLEELRARSGQPQAH